MRPLLVSSLLLSLAAPAAADDSSYIGGGVAAGTLGYTIAAEASVDGGVQLAGKPWLYGHARLSVGVAGDIEDASQYVAPVAGVELRTTGRRLRGVAGVDVGALFLDDQTSPEDHLDDDEVLPLISAHAGGELVLDPVVLRAGVSTLYYLPMLSAGLAVQW